MIFRWGLGCISKNKGAGQEWSRPVVSQWSSAGPSLVCVLTWNPTGSTEPFGGSMAHRSQALTGRGTM